MIQREIVLILGMTFVTFLIRYPVLALSGRVQMPDRLLHALNYVPPAVLTAIVVPAVLVQNDQLWLSVGNSRLIGALVALGIGFWRQNLLLTIVSSMAAFLIWQVLAS